MPSSISKQKKGASLALRQHAGIGQVKRLCEATPGGRPGCCPDWVFHGPVSYWDARFYGNVFGMFRGRTGRDADRPSVLAAEPLARAPACPCRRHAGSNSGAADRQSAWAPWYGIGASTPVAPQQLRVDGNDDGGGRHEHRQCWYQEPGAQVIPAAIGMAKAL